MPEPLPPIGPDTPTIPTPIPSEDSAFGPLAGSVDDFLARKRADDEAAASGNDVPQVPNEGAVVEVDDADIVSEEDARKVKTVRIKAARPTKYTGGPTEVGDPLPLPADKTGEKAPSPEPKRAEPIKPGFVRDLFDRVSKWWNERGEAKKKEVLDTKLAEAQGFRDKEKKYQEAALKWQAKVMEFAATQGDAIPVLPMPGESEEVARLRAVEGYAKSKKMAGILKDMEGFNTRARDARDKAKKKEKEAGDVEAKWKKFQDAAAKARAKIDGRLEAKARGYEAQKSAHEGSRAVLQSKLDGLKAAGDLLQAKFDGLDAKRKEMVADPLFAKSKLVDEYTKKMNQLKKEMKTNADAATALEEAIAAYDTKIRDVQADIDDIAEERDELRGTPKKTDAKPAEEAEKNDAEAGEPAPAPAPPSPAPHAPKPRKPGEWGKGDAGSGKVEKGRIPRSLKAKDEGGALSYKDDLKEAIRRKGRSGEVAGISASLRGEMADGQRAVREKAELSVEAAKAASEAIQSMLEVKVPLDEKALAVWSKLRDRWDTISHTIADKARSLADVIEDLGNDEEEFDWDDLGLLQREANALGSCQDGLRQLQQETAAAAAELEKQIDDERKQKKKLLMALSSPLATVTSKAAAALAQNGVFVSGVAIVRSAEDSFYTQRPDAKGRRQDGTLPPEAPPDAPKPTRPPDASGPGGVPSGPDAPPAAKPDAEAAPAPDAGAGPESAPASPEAKSKLEAAFAKFEEIVGAGARQLKESRIRMQQNAEYFGDVLERSGKRDLARQWTKSVVEEFRGPLQRVNAAMEAAAGFQAMVASGQRLSTENVAQLSQAIADMQSDLAQLRQLESRALTLASETLPKLQGLNLEDARKQGGFFDRSTKEFMAQAEGAAALLKSAAAAMEAGAVPSPTLPPEAPPATPGPAPEQPPESPRPPEPTPDVPPEKTLMVSPELAKKAGELFAALEGALGGNLESFSASVQAFQRRMDAFVPLIDSAGLDLQDKTAWEDVTATFADAWPVAEKELAKALQIRAELAQGKQLTKDAAQDYWNAFRDVQDALSNLAEFDVAVKAVAAKVGKAPAGTPDEKKSAKQFSKEMQRQAESLSLALSAADAASEKLEEALNAAARSTFSS